MALSDYLTLKPLVFGALDFVTSTESGTVTIVSRESALDAATLSFLTEAAEYSSLERVYVAVRLPSRFDEVQQLVAPKLANLDVDIIPVKIDSFAFLSALSSSSALFLTNQYDIPNYRLFNRQRDVIRIHHGILTKAYGNLTAVNLDAQERRRRKNLRYPNKQRYITNLGIDVQSVESDVERFYRATAEGRSPTVFRKYGYPRFDRIRRLLAGDCDPIIPRSTVDQLNSSESYRVLYAPTHKDDTYSTTLFPFADFELAELRQFLRTENIELYVRMHFSEDEAAFYEEIVDNETIFRAGQKFSPSPTEILPSFDMLVTDYSSIYVDYLPVDNPIVFLKDDHETFVANRGLAFEYDDYFPGRKIETFETFLSHLEMCAKNGSDNYDEDRKFVRRTFLPNREKPFLEHVIDCHLSQS